VANSAKWSIFRHLSEAREHYGLTSSEITTVQGLLSILEPGKGFMIYASNRVLSDRAHGINERTLRRHISKLVEIGLITRVSSPNGKRFKVSNTVGDEIIFGLDLAAFFARSAEIENIAVQIRSEKRDIRFLKARIKATLHNLQEILGECSLVREGLNLVRRKLGMQDLDQARRRFDELLQEVQSSHTTESLSTLSVDETSREEGYPCADLASETNKMPARDGQYDRQISYSKNTYIESDGAPNAHVARADDEALLKKTLACCSEALSLRREEIRCWKSLERLAWEIAGYCQISPALMQSAYEAIGAKEACITVVALLQRSVGQPIRSFPAYFRSITIGSKSADFDPERLLVAN